MIAIAGALLAGGRGIEVAIQVNSVLFMAKTKMTRKNEKYLGPNPSTATKIMKPAIVRGIGYIKNLISYKLVRNSFDH